MTNEQKLEFGIEIVAAMHANLYEGDIEMGRIEALMDTEIDRMEDLDFNELSDKDKNTVINCCKFNKEKLHKQAMYLAEITLVKYNSMMGIKIEKS